MLKDINDDFDNFADDFLQEKTPRGIVIIASSKIDDILFQILDKYLLPKISKNNDQDELLMGDRPLSTFSSRIKLIFRLGFIDRSFYTILEQVRSIRNISAHRTSFDISIPPLRDSINSLLKMLADKESFALTKRRYFNDEYFDKIKEIKCCYLTICVILEAINLKTVQLLLNKETIKISLK